MFNLVLYICNFYIYVFIFQLFTKYCIYICNSQNTNKRSRGKTPYFEFFPQN